MFFVGFCRVTRVSRNKLVVKDLRNIYALIYYAIIQLHIDFYVLNSIT